MTTLVDFPLALLTLSGIGTGTGVELFLETPGSDFGRISGSGLAGSLNFVGKLNDTSGLLMSGPPILLTRGGFTATLTGGS